MSQVRGQDGAALIHQSAIRRTQNFTVAASGAAIVVSGRGSYAIMVVGVGGVPTAWDVRLEGTLNGTNWTELTGMTHATGDGNGTIKWSGANRFPVHAVRFRLNAITLGPASSIDCVVEAAL